MTAPEDKEVQAACACLEVVYKPVKHKDGSLTERWVCRLDDSHAFIRRPASPETTEAKETDMDKNDSEYCRGFRDGQEDAAKVLQEDGLAPPTVEATKPWTPSDTVVLALAASTPPHLYLPALTALLDVVEPAMRQPCVDGWIERKLVLKADLQNALNAVPDGERLVLEYRVRELAKMWDNQQTMYPGTSQGEYSAAAVRCCIRELLGILEAKP